MSLFNLIVQAYSINSLNVDAPAWTKSQRFDIAAKVPPKTSEAEFAVMMQHLLMDRFNLVVRYKSQTSSSYDLVVGRSGPKIAKATGTSLPNDNRLRADSPTKSPQLDKNGYPLLPDDGEGMIVLSNRARLLRARATMEQLASDLSAQLRTPINDATGLKGEYQISLYWDQRSSSFDLSSETVDHPVTDPQGPSLIMALQQQLGLTLRQAKTLTKSLVVDHIEKLPTAN